MCINGLIPQKSHNPKKFWCWWWSNDKNCELLGYVKKVALVKENEGTNDDESEDNEIVDNGKVKKMSHRTKDRKTNNADTWKNEAILCFCSLCDGAAQSGNEYEIYSSIRRFFFVQKTYRFLSLTFFLYFSVGCMYRLWT